MIKSCFVHEKTLVRKKEFCALINKKKLNRRVLLIRIAKIKATLGSKGVESVSEVHRQAVISMD